VPFSAPLWGWIRSQCARLAAERAALRVVGGAVEMVLMMALLLLSSMWLAGGTYNPFIYFRF
jgi:hypothetical protein